MPTLTYGRNQSPEFIDLHCRQHRCRPDEPDPGPVLPVTPPILAPDMVVKDGWFVCGVGGANRTL